MPTPEILPCVNPSMVCREVSFDGSGFIARISTRFSGDFLVLMRPGGWASVLKNGDPTPRQDVLDEARRQIAHIFGGAR